MVKVRHRGSIKKSKKSGRHDDALIERSQNSVNYLWYEMR